MREKAVVLTLSYCQPQWEGLRVEGYSKKAGGEEGEHRAAVKLAQAHRQKTTPALCGHIERERWRYSRQCAGGHTQI